MPIREYLCRNNHRFEIIEMSSRRGALIFVCPECGEEADIQVSAPGMIASAGMPLKESAIGGAIRRVKASPVVA